MFYPTYHYKRIVDIAPEFLLERGLTHLVLDVDNTLATNEHPIPSGGVSAWLERLDGAGISCVILSNNSEERVRPFAALLGLPFVAGGRKPLCGGYERCRALFGCEKASMAAIGDQLFTDVWGGCRYGIVSILVDPIAPENVGFFKVKRAVEKHVFRYYGRRGLADYTK